MVLKRLGLGDNESPRLSPNGRTRSAARCLAALTCVFALYAVGVYQDYFTGDDAFISFRYARHLSDGMGLVWNPGERIEGYTNFLWVLIIAGALRLGLPPEGTANALGIASGLGVLLILGLRAHRRGWGKPFFWLAPVALASSRSFTAWSTGGLETMFFSLLCFAGLVRFSDEHDRNSAWPWASAALLALATLTRPEGMLFASVSGCFLAVAVLLRRRSLGAALLWVSIYWVPVGSHLLWRHSYYGFWLPNTFYAKVPGTWWEQGAKYLMLFAGDYNALWFLPLVAAALLMRTDFTTRLFGVSTIAYLVYVASVGGDRFEFRFLVVILPYLFWLAAAGLEAVAEKGADRLTRPGFVWGAAAVLSAVVVLEIYSGSRDPAASKQRSGINSLEMIRDYARDRVEQGKFLRRLSDENILPEDVVIGVGGAGALPYHTDWTTIDRRGLNDLRIAHAKLETRGEIAHEREPSYEYLRERRVVMFDVLNRLVHRSLEPKSRLKGARLGGQELVVKAVRVEDAYLIFATFVDDEELGRIFSGLEIIH